MNPALDRAPSATRDSHLLARLAAMRLYVVTDAAAGAQRTVDVVSAACDGGADCVQLRRKTHDGIETLRLAERCREVTARARVIFVVNDRLDVAMASDADGVHLGQDDLPIAVARRLWPAGLVGRSTHSVAQALEAEAQGADYLGVGPVHATPTKPGRPAVGVELVRAVSPLLQVPWVAIGGIDAATLGEVVTAGARSVAVVRAVTDAGDPAAVTRELRAALVELCP